jgi:RNA polymerase sigma-70 factor, ECF subfamily
MPVAAPNQQRLYDEASTAHGAALERLARSYEEDSDKRQDLLQDIHLALWRSLERFEARCSLRTWVYRIAHNVATSHMLTQRRHNSRALVGLEALESIASDADSEHATDRRMMLDRLYAMIQQLAPIDRQVMLLYLEGMDAASIGEITGLSAANVATKISRIKKILGRQVDGGGSR